LCCDGGKERLGVVCGQMRKRVWINRSDLVLIAKWEGMTNDDKCSIVHKYSESDIRQLRKEGELPDNFKTNLDDFDEIDDSVDPFAGISDSDDSDDSDDETENESEEETLKEIDINDI